MHDPVFEDALAALARLTLDDAQAARLGALLDDSAGEDACLNQIASAVGTPPCPRCHCPRVHRCGSASNLQRWRCLGCRRSFNALTCIPLARLRHKACWLPYLQCVLDSRSVRSAAERVGVHRTTSFRWRHRFVPGAAHQRPDQLTGIVEADETYLLESQKGSRKLTRPARRRGGVASRRGISGEHDYLLVARDRTRQTLDFHTGRGPVSSAQLGACLGPVLAPDITLVSDGAASYLAFTRDAGITHETLNLRAGIRARGKFHLNNVNGWHARFKNWLRHFKGVASRYLIHYAGWQRVLDDGRLCTPAKALTSIVQFAK